MQHKDRREHYLKKTSLLLDFSERHATRPESVSDLAVAKSALSKGEESIDRLMDMRLTDSQRRKLRTLSSQVKRIKKTLRMTTSVLSGLEYLGLREKSKPRMPIETIIIHRSAQAVREIYPQVERLYLVGSRLRRNVGRDIEFVAVVRNPEQLPKRNLRGLRFGYITIDLFFSLPDEVETHILEYGLGADIIHWKRAAKKKGLTLNRYGLWKKSVRVTAKMAEIAKILKKPLKPFLVATLENPL